MSDKQNINAKITIFLDKAIEMAEDLLEHKFDDVIMSISVPPSSGAIGCHIPQYFNDINSSNTYSYISLHPALFLYEHKATLFATIIHELAHAKLKHEYMSVNTTYAAHGDSFKNIFLKIGVEVDKDGNVESIDKSGKYFLVYENEFKDLNIPLLYNHEHFKIEEKVSIQGRAICPSCDLEVITFNSQSLICKECHAELNNNYMKLLIRELQAREEAHKKLLNDFEYLCVYYPLEAAKEIAYVKEALELSDIERLEALQYNGIIDKSGKEKLYKAAYNLLISHKNIITIKELANV